jgi:hypothetical protein
MKTKKGLMKLIFAGSFIFCLFAISSCKKDSSPDNRPYTLKGDASGSQMVPAVTGDGTGTFDGTYDPATKMLTYTANWSNLTGAPISGGFYNGASGSAGTAVGTPWTMDSTWTGTGTYSGTMTLTPEQASQLIGGNWYYSMGTSANPSGEMRGQISATR